MDKETKEINPFIKWIKWRIEKNKNVIIVINGSTGSGKTYSALWIAQQISKELNTNFTVSLNVDFKFVKLLKKMYHPDNTKAGTPFIFEEVGAMGGGASAMSWYEESNKFFNSFMQTSRHRNQILIFTCPLFTNLDNNSRKLCHMQMITESINFQRKETILKPFLLQVNQTTGKMYFKYLRFKKNGRTLKMTRYIAHLVDKETLKAYEKAKTQYTDMLNTEIMDKEAVIQNKKEHSLHMKENIAKLVKKGKNNSQIARELCIGRGSVQYYRIRYAI